MLRGTSKGRDHAWELRSQPSARVVVLVAALGVALGACGRREIALQPIIAVDAATNDVGWGSSVIVNEGGATCTPGHPVEVACGCDGLGFCSGFPQIFICTQGTTIDDCAAGIGRIGGIDEMCGSCAGVTFTCPADGWFITATSLSTGDECFMEGHSR